jgi:DNA polymerase III subunit alpha
MIKHVQDLGMDSVALTDNGTMYGVIEFYKTAKKLGVKPIIGVDFFVARHGRHMKRNRLDNKPHRLVCLAENDEGYQNLIRLSSIGFMEGFYYRARIDKEVLKEHCKGIIALSGGYIGEINELLKMDSAVEAEKVACWYRDVFGPDNFFLELVDRPEIGEQEAINTQLIEMAKRIGVGVVATKNTNYLKPQDVEAWKILNCIKGGRTLEHFERLNQYDHDASMVSQEYMIERFKDVPEAIENTVKIADRCNVEITLGEWNFPKFEIPEGKTFREVLTEGAFDKLKEKRGRGLTDEEIDRLNYELDIIDQKGFCPYFLIVSDFISWARDNGIMTTTRGSAAGSLVGYSIGISSIDPLRYLLPFERFLNPQRPSAPDIDADFADNRRDEVLDYVREKYGHDKVAQICTFGKMLARGSLRDVGRALGFSYDLVDEIAKLIPMGAQGMPMTLDRALKEAPDLKRKYDTDANVRRIISLAKQIEGCGRHVSIHAAGTVISPTELTDFTPLQIDTREGKIITQYEMHSVESAGLVKMDFLGIRNLSILGDAIKIVRKTKGVEIDIEEIPIDDAGTFRLLAEGNTMGVFQLSSDGMTKYLVELKPTRVEDIMAMVALYRPGPIEFIPEYIKRKHNPEIIDYPHERLKDILEASLGLLIYQDDVMLTAIKLAGYSWLDADKFRKAMGKKIPELMLEQEKKFKDGCVSNKIPLSLAKDLWERIKPFAMYAFNKSHAASYGMVAYQTAYMKSNYPAEYMSALMTAESGDLEKIADAVHECERMGIEVLPPDINESLKDFTYITDEQIRFGLLVIKNLGEEVIETIIAERKANGDFKHLSDFAGRVSHRAFNKKSLDAMIKAGALDRFGERNLLLQNIDRILIHNKKIQREKETNQQNLFAAAPQVMDQEIPLRPSPEASMRSRLSWEKELLGLYVSAHPYDPCEEKFGAYLESCIQVPNMKDGVFARCGGVISSSKEIVTKKGDPMAFLTLEDTSGQQEVIVFPRTFEQYKHVLLPDQIVLVSGKVSKREGEEAKILANSFIVVHDEQFDSVANMLASGQWVPETMQPSHVEEIVADVPPPKAKGSVSIALKGKPTQELVGQLREIFMAAPGPKPVCLLVESGGQMRKIQTDYAVAATDRLISSIVELVGRQNVSVE